MLTRRPRSSLLPLALLASATLAGGCVSLPRAPSVATRAPVALPGMAPCAEAPFVLEPGDILAAHITSVPPQVYDSLVVDGRGRVHVPGLGELHLGERTLDDAQRLIADALRQHDRLGQVFLRVSDPGGHRMTVLGEVARQGSVDVTPGMRLSEAFAAAGGTATDAELGETADLAAARLVRDGGELPVDLRQALVGDARHDILVRPGDHLFVPEHKTTISVLGQVEVPTAFFHRSGMRVTEALAQAGGITVGGDKSDVRLIRGTVEEPIVYHADFSAIARGDRPDVALRPGDVLFVDDHPAEDFGEVMDLVAPMLGVALTATVLALTVVGE